MDRYRTGSDGAYLFEIQSYLVERGQLFSDYSLCQRVQEREEGKHFTFQEHVRGLVYALLSNQTKWIRIAPHLNEIDELFRNYDPSFLRDTEGSYFAEGLFRLKCGNVRTRDQMDALADNVRLMERLQARYGSMDAYVTSAPAYRIVKNLSDPSSAHKLKMIGEALAWEYLRNVGIDGAKPDTHLRRFLGNARMGNARDETATPEEALRQVDELAAATGLRLVEIDNLIWSYCADGYGEICTASPHCEKCVIRKYCHSRGY